MLRAVLPCALAALCGCLPSVTIDGLEFACDAGAECSPGFRCWRGVCTQDAGWNLGTACAADEDCANGTCSAGVCCSRRCEGACERCDQSLPGQCDPLPPGSAGSPSCAPYFCDGTSSLCPGSCLSDPDCLQGNYCDAGRCTGLQVQGDACVRGGTCASGLCVDRRCCDTSCANPCDACDVPGNLGRCSLAPLGRVPSPSCGLYACSGASVLCPSTCGGDAGCVPPASCSFYRVCQPRLDSLYEPFNTNLLDAGTWSFYQDPGTSLAVANQRLQLTVNPWAGPAYTGIATQRTYDGTNTQLSAQLVLAGNQSLGSLETYFQYLATDYNNRFGFDVYQGGVHTVEQIAGAYTEPFAPVPYDPTVHRFLRLRVTGGTAIWETSADGGSFTVLGTTTTKPWMQTTYLELGSGAWNPEDAGSFSAWDNVRK